MAYLRYLASREHTISAKARDVSQINNILLVAIGHAKQNCTEAVAELRKWLPEDAVSLEPVCQHKLSNNRKIQKKSEKQDCRGAVKSNKPSIHTSHYRNSLPKLTVSGPHITGKIAFPIYRIFFY